MNRAARRKQYKRNRRHLFYKDGIRSWAEFNSTQITQRPYQKPKGDQ